MQAVILAGGKGTRLKPFTTNFPKPLVPIDDIPILEVVLRQLKKAGFTHIILAVNHLAELIMAFFGNGDKFGVKIEYSIEDEPLGTAGPLRIVNNLQENFLVMNGDLLTTIDYKNLYDDHCSANADATIASYKKDIKIDLGVLKTEKGIFQDYIEKPTYSFEVSMGIYAMNRSVLEYIPLNKKFDLPELMLALHREKKHIKCYRGEYYWLDIGRVDDYDAANEIFKNKRDEFLP